MIDHQPLTPQEEMALVVFVALVFVGMEQLFLLF